MSDSNFDIIGFLKERKAAITTAFLVFLALLASLGTGFQNATAIIELLIQGVYVATGNPWFWGAIVGGISSTVVNFCLNFDLLENFWERVSGRKSFAPYFSDYGEAFRYGLGVVVFVVTGILFALTAFSVGATGGLAIAAIAAGAFVALVTIPQELETWLESFDDPVAVAIGRRIYDINHEEDNAKILKLIGDLKKEIEGAILKKELKKLKEKLAKQAENEAVSAEQQKLKKREVKSIDRVLLHLAKNKIDLDQLITFCSGVDTSLKKKLDKIKRTIEIEQAKISLLEHQDKIAVIQALTNLKKEVEENQPKTNVIDAIQIGWRDLTPGRFVGLIISVGNVLALSLLFTIGLTTFLSGVGVAALPALIIGFSVAFTFGASTEFYFYHYFLAGFCDHIAYKWDELLASPNWGLGIVTVMTNAVVNGILAYFGVILLESLLIAAGIAAPPLLILAVVAAVFAGVASLLLGSNFWIESAERLFNWGSTKEPAKENRAEDSSEEKLLLLNDEEKKEEIKKAEVNIPKEKWDWMFFPLTEKSSSIELQDVTTVNECNDVLSF